MTEQEQAVIAVQSSENSGVGGLAVEYIINVIMGDGV